MTLMRSDGTEEMMGRKCRKFKWMPEKPTRKDAGGGGGGHRREIDRWPGRSR